MDDANDSAAEPPSNTVFISDFPLDPASDGTTLTLRDDRLAFPAFIDAASSCRRRGIRFRLIDQGRLTPSELEWLGQAGADIYTSDRARQALAEFVLMRKSAVRGGALVAYFHHGPLADEPAAGVVPFEALREMGLSGIDIHISDDKGERDAARLAELADDCSRGGAVFVLYRHGPLGEAQENLARRGAWIHVSNATLAGDDEVRFLCDCVDAARKAGSNVILHVDAGISASVAGEIMAKGGIVLFKTPPSDYRSPLRRVEDAAKRFRLSPRSYYLFTDFVL